MRLALLQLFLILSLVGITAFQEPLERETISYFEVEAETSENISKDIKDPYFHNLPALPYSEHNLVQVHHASAQHFCPGFYDPLLKPPTA